MSNQIVITSGAKLRDLDDVIIGTDGILSSVAFNVANGVPRLDENGKILVSQLPNSVMEFKGVWNASTNSPTLVNGTGNAGDVWLCNVAGTVNFGAGPIAFAVGDYAVYTGTVWARSSGATGTVTSVGVSRDGNALAITGSPVTTSGTINLGFSGDNTQYINGAGNLTTFPTLITSIGLTMPAAFGVSNSPLTANGTIGVTALGYPSQYIRGDGTLADFPTSGGGGSSVSYYLNGGTSQGTIGGTTYYEMSKIANTGTMADFSKTGNGFIVAFLTDAGDPSLLQIPAGNWNYEIYASMSSNGGTPEMYAELYVYDGTTFTLLSTSAHEILYDGINLNLYTFAMAVPETVLTVTDRLAIKLYADNSGGKTTTIHTQDSHLCQIITTFTTGLTALNGLTAQVQYFGTGTSGSDFNIVSSVDTHTFNLPTASATKRGALSSADWSTFNGKQDYITAGTTLEYWRGDKTWQTLNTSVVPELTNLYFTDARARTAISLTTTGSTGASTYNNTTGVLNIPNYADQYVGTVTSVGLSAPTGFSVSGSPVTSSGTLALSFASGYSLPTNVKQSNWDDAYTWVAAFPTQTGNTGKFLTTDGSSLSWVANPLGTVTSVDMSVPTGLTVSGNPITTSGTLAVTLTAGYSIPTNASQTTWDTAYTNRITSLTVTGSSGASTLISNVLNIPTYTLSGLGGQPLATNLTSLSGLTFASTSFVKMTAAGTFSLDTNTYALASALGDYLPLTGGTLTGPLGGTSATFSSTIDLTGNITTTASSNSAYTIISGIQFKNSANSGNVKAKIVSINGVDSDDMGLSFQTSTNTTNVSEKLRIVGSGAATFSSSVTATSFIKTSGTASQFLKADGSVDSSTYLTTTSAASTYLPLAGGTMSGSITYSGYLLKDLTSVTKASIIINWAGAGYFGLGPNGNHIIRLDEANPTTGAWIGATDVVLQLGTKTVLTDSDIGVTVQAKLTNPITGTGSTNKIAKFSGSTSLADSYITDAAGAPTTITKDGSAITAALVSIYPVTGTNASILNLDNGGAGTFYLGRQNSAGNSQLLGSLGAYDSVIGHTSTQTLHLVTSALSRLAIDGSGNSVFSGSLRLGGSTTAKQFVVNQGTTSGYFLSGEASGTELAYWYYNTTEIQFSSKSSTRSLQFLTTDLPRMTILSGGNIGIGTITPNQKLEIASTTGVAQIRLNSASGGQNASIELYQGGSPKWEIGTGMATSTDLEIRDRVAGANRITISSSTGNVLINTPTGVTGGGAFQVNGNVNINGVFQINGTTIGGGGGSGVTGSGTSGYITKWTGASTIGNSIIQDNGSTVTMIGGVETVARFAASGDSTIIIGGNSAQGVGSGEQYITYQNGTTNSNAWMVGMDDGEDWRFAYGAVGEITDANSLIRLTQGGNFIIGSVTDEGSKLQVYGNLYVSGSSVYAGGVTYSGTQTFNGLVYLNSTTYVASGQGITWKGSSGTTYDFSISNSGTVPYILSGVEIDLNAPIGMRYGLIYTFKGNGSAAYNVNILNSGKNADELQFLGGLLLNTTSCGFVPPKMTTTQRNALNATVKVAGCIIYNTTLNTLQCYNGSAWADLF